MNTSMNDRGDCRTDPATPGLLNIVKNVMKYFMSGTWL